jgi:peptide deformylase
MYKSMPTLNILQYPDLRLRDKAVVVTDVFDPDLQSTIDDMLETLASMPNCVGLAASQLDIKNPQRVFVIPDLAEVKHEHVFINPEIIHAVDEAIGDEGCMSVYPEDFHAKVKRAGKITFRALTRTGEAIEMTVDGLFARCVQHEIDHLNGILFFDHLSALKNKMFKKKVDKFLKA